MPSRVGLGIVCMGSRGWRVVGASFAGSREGESKLRSPAWPIALGPDATSVRLNNSFADCQAKARPAFAAAGRAFLEEAGQYVGGQASAFVDDGYGDMDAFAVLR